MSIENGGPAFPLGNTPEEWMNGMTLLDYFAAKAMQALISKYGHTRGEVDICAEISYDFSRAMLEARKDHNKEAV